MKRKGTLPRTSEPNIEVFSFSCNAATMQSLRRCFCPNSPLGLNTLRLGGQGPVKEPRQERYQRRALQRLPGIAGLV